MAKKKDLGKGIRALLHDIDTSSSKNKKSAVSTLASSVADIDVDKIETNPFQPRSEFDQDLLQELADSIKLHGIVQPITVRSLGNDSFQLISGERRLRASKLAGLEAVPAYIRLADDQEMLEFALIENIQRKDLNAMEIALSYQRLMHECDLTQESLSERVGKKRSTISNYIRLLNLPPQIQQAVKNENISMGHARVLAGIEDMIDQIYWFQLTLDKNYSVRQLENETKKAFSSSKDTHQKSPSEHPEVKKMREKISALLGVSIKIERNKAGKGTIKIPFQNDDDLNDIVDTLLDT